MIEPRDVTGLKIGITRDYFWDYCQDDVGAVVENAIDELVTAGATSFEVPLPEAAASIQVWGEGAIVASEGYAFPQSQLPAWIDSLDPNVRVRMETALEAKTLTNSRGALPHSEFICIGTCQIRSRRCASGTHGPITPRVSPMLRIQRSINQNLLSLAIPCQVMWVFAL